MESETKPKTGISRLLEIAMMKKTLILLSMVLSVASSIASFVPYIAIFYIVRELLTVFPDFSNLNSSAVTGYGWMALIGVVSNILLYFFALMFSHLSAFGTLYELKVNFASHLAKIPLGFHVIAGSGKLRKIMDENIEKTEGFIAHQLPDIVAAITAPIVMLVILFAVDFRFGLAAFIGIVIAFVIQIKAYGNDGAREMMKKYQKSMEDMNNATVEYVRGITVVKAYKQTVFSFNRLIDTIKEYTSFVIPYTLSWENYMSSFSTIVNNIYLFIVPVGIFIGMNTANYNEYLSKFIFYLLFVPKPVD